MQNDPLRGIAYKKRAYNRGQIMVHTTGVRLWCPIPVAVSSNPRLGLRDFVIALLVYTGRTAPQHTYTHPHRTNTLIFPNDCTGNFKGSP